MRNNLFARMASVVAISILTACGTTPSTIVLPYAVAADENTDAPNRYHTGPKTDSPLLGAMQGTGLQLEKNIDGVVAQIRAHQVTWANEADRFAAGVDGLSNSQFAGAVVGAIGVLANSLDVGKVGAALAGGAGIWGDRYKLSVQAQNYRSASKAMQCMYKQVSAIPSGYWSAMFDPSTGRVKTTSAQFLMLAAGQGAAPVQANARQGIRSLNDTFTKIHTSVQEVRERLGDAQRKVALTSPSSGDIAMALKAKQNNEQKVQEQAAAMQSGISSFARASTTQRQTQFSSLNLQEPGLVALASSFQEVDEGTTERILQLPSELDICVNLMGNS